MKQGRQRLRRPPDDDHLVRSSRHYLTHVVGEWIHNLYSWQLFATLTFATEVPGTVAFDRFTSLCRRLIRERVRRHVAVAWFIDRQRRGVLHIHTLLAIHPMEEGCLTVPQLDGLWPWGDRLIEQFNGDGAAYYGARHSHWDINVVCPGPTACRRPGKGCLLAPGPWPTPSALEL